MILIDCGNSTLKAQWRDPKGLRASFATSYSAGWTRRLQRWMRDLSADRCYQASVLDTARQAELDCFLAERFGENMTGFVSERRAGGVTNAYPEPRRLGIDRWLALIGAAGMVDGDCIVIDAGSAITLDLLRADGLHLGGAILPGVNTSLERFKRIFSHIDFGDSRIVEIDTPGSSTEAAIQIDYAHDSVHRLRDLVTCWKKDLDPETRILLAGGDASRIQRELDSACNIVPDLVFQGMLRLARQ